MGNYFFKNLSKVLVATMRGADPTNFQVRDLSNCGVTRGRACAMLVGPCFLFFVRPALPSDTPRK